MREQPLQKRLVGRAGEDGLLVQEPQEAAPVRLPEVQLGGPHHGVGGGLVQEGNEGGGGPQLVRDVTAFDVFLSAHTKKQILKTFRSVKAKRIQKREFGFCGGKAPYKNLIA